MARSSHDGQFSLRNMCLPGFVKIRRIVFEIAGRGQFCDLFRHYVTLTFDLLTPKVDIFMHLFERTTGKHVSTGHWGPGSGGGVKSLRLRSFIDDDNLVTGRWRQTVAY